MLLFSDTIAERKINNKNEMFNIYVVCTEELKVSFRAVMVQELEGWLEFIDGKINFKELETREEKTEYASQVLNEFKDAIEVSVLDNLVADRIHDLLSGKEDENSLLTPLEEDDRLVEDEW